MSSLHATSSADALSKSFLPGSLVLLLAVGAGLSVASLYCNQPMLGIMPPDLGTSNSVVGSIPTLTQLGYALGILLLAPLGDRYDRRRIILAKGVVQAAALLLAGSSSSIGDCHSFASVQRSVVELMRPTLRVPQKLTDSVANWSTGNGVRDAPIGN